MYLQCTSHFVVAEYISQLVGGWLGGKNVKTVICSVGHPTGQTHLKI